MNKNRESKDPSGLRGVAVILAAGTNGLGVVRSLHVKRIGAIVACRSKFDPAYLSRLPIRKVVIPATARLDRWLADFLVTVEGEADSVIATSDEFASVLQGLSATGELHLPCLLPPDGLVDILNDKRSEIELIERMDIPIPRTLVDLDELRSGNVRMEFPVIVKPRTYRGFEVLGAKNRILESEADLSIFLNEFPAALDGFIAQEIIPGDETCLWVCNATFNRRAEMVSAFTFQRLGTIPYLYGVTTFAISRHNPVVKAMCARMGRALNYTGAAMFEFKMDPRSKQYCYIEINPRLGMCNWFDAECGVNNAYNVYAVSVGLSPDSNLEQQADGRTYLNLVLDMVARIRARQGWRAIIRHYIANFPRRVVHPAWQWWDPMPALALYINAMLKRLN